MPGEKRMIRKTDKEIPAEFFRELAHIRGTDRKTEMHIRFYPPGAVMLTCE